MKKPYKFLSTKKAIHPFKRIKYLTRQKKTISNSLYKMSLEVQKWNKRSGMDLMQTLDEFRKCKNKPELEVYKSVVLKELVIKMLDFQGLITNYTKEDQDYMEYLYKYHLVVSSVEMIEKAGVSYIKHFLPPYWYVFKIY